MNRDTQWPAAMADTGRREDAKDLSKAESIVRHARMLSSGIQRDDRQVVLIVLWIPARNMRE